MVVNMLVEGVTSNIYRDNSRILEINGNRYPEINVGFCMGMMILTIRFHQPTPKITAASSISFPNCRMALIPAREAKGRYLTEPTNMRMAKVPYREGIIPR